MGKNLRFDSVLIIDDDELDIFITSGLLQKAVEVGEIITEKNPRDALELLKGLCDSGRMPDLIILDLKMPGLDGIAFLEELAACPCAMDMPCNITILSAYLDMEPEVVNLTKKYPFVKRYIQKPFNAEKLLEQ